MYRSQRRLEMAGHVVKRVLKQPEVDKTLLQGTALWKWDEVSERPATRVPLRQYTVPMLGHAIVRAPCV